MTCEELRDKWELFALGLLDDPEQAELQEHLQRGCETCVPAFRRALVANTSFATLAKPVEPPARLRSRILASVGDERSTRWGWLPGWVAFAACLLVAFLWVTARDRKQATELAQARAELSEARTQAGRTAAELARTQAALDLLNEPETRLVISGRGVPLPPRARVFLNRTRGVLLLADNMPPVPEGKIFEMWVIPRTGAPRPAGLFRAEPGGRAIHLLSEPVDIASTGAIAVTLEPESGSPAPTSTPFIVVPL